MVRCSPAVVGVVCVSGCSTTPNPLYCDENSDCHNGTMCDLGTHGCVTAEGDASIDDGALDSPDAPSGPVVQNNALADLVLGQPSFVIVETGSTTASTVGCGVSTNGASLFASEFETSRVLVWSPLPTTTNAGAQLVLGKASFTDATHANTVSANTIGNPVGMAAVGTKLVVSDAEFHRALVWNPAPTASNQAASFVLGQTSTTDNQYGNPPSAARMRSSRGAWTDGSKLVIVDSVNWRVLIWNTFPTAMGQPADLVLGQADFTSRVNVQPPTASSLLVPYYAVGHDGRLYVSDRFNNRVLIWNTFPTLNSQPADIVLGQPDFTSKDPGLSGTTMNFPTGLAVVDNALFVADTNNDRVLVYQPLPTVSATAASFVLGQIAMDAGANNPAAAQSSLDDPYDLAVAGDLLFVADCGHHRILRFHLNLG